MLTSIARFKIIISKPFTVNMIYFYSTSNAKHGTLDLHFERPCHKRDALFKKANRWFVWQFMKKMYKRYNVHFFITLGSNLWEDSNCVWTRKSFWQSNQKYAIGFPIWKIELRLSNFLLKARFSTRIFFNVWNVTATLKTAYKAIVDAFLTWCRPILKINWMWFLFFNCFQNGCRGNFP